MLRAIAIDDEPIALEVISNFSKKVSYIRLEASFTDAFRALDYLHAHETDLIFLDIKMPDISGIDFLQSLASPPIVIFTTAYSEHAVRGFELDAVDYLLKPFSLARFLKACARAHEQFDWKKSAVAGQAPSDYFFIKCGYEQVKIGMDEILYVESSGNYVQFILKGRKIISRLTMSQAAELLPVDGFVRIHRSYIVSKKAIDRIDRNLVWIKQSSLPVGAAYSEEIKKITNP